MELLVVIGIIAVITGMISFNSNQARSRARDVQRKNDMKELGQALELYKNDNNQQYPNAADYDALIPMLTNYVKSEFKDPKIAQTGNDAAWDNYTYTSASPYTSYTLTSCFENRSDTMATGGDCGTSGTGKTYTYTSN